MSARSNLLIVLLIGLAPVASALDGRVVTNDGEPLAGGRVQVLGSHGSVMVDRTGHFVIEPTPPLPFELLVTRPDGVVVQPILVTALPEGEPLEVRVTIAMEGSVTVLGSIPDLELPPAAAYTLTGAADLQQRKPQQLWDVMETVPGATRVGDGHAAVPALRGMAQSRTLILLDEGRVTAERRAGPSATFLDPATVDEIEVVRGPGSVAYGSDAFGGLIRARTRIQSPGDPSTLRYSLAGGSVDDQRSVNVDYGTGVLDGGLLIGAHYRSFDDYESPEGTVPDSGYEGYGARLGYQRALGDGLLRMLWRTDLGRDIGKPATDSATRPTSYPEENSHRLGASYERAGPGSWSRLSVSATWAEYQLLTAKDRLATSSSPRILAEADVFSHDYGLRVEAERPAGPARLVLGLDVYGRYGLHATNTATPFGPGGEVDDVEHEVSVDSARRDNAGLFAGLSGTVGSVALSGGLRVDHVVSRNSGGFFGDYDTSATALSGFAAGSFSLGHDLDLTAQVARGFRDALLSDRYYHGLTARGVITGNPDLDPETSLQLDLALRYSLGPLRLATFAYLYRIDDLIERYRSGADYLFRNRGRAEVRGVEVEGTLAIGADLLAQLAIQLQSGKVIDDDTPMDDIPPVGVIFALRREPSQRWWWLARVAAYAQDDDPGPTERVVPGYAVLDAGLGWRLSPALELQLSGRNLLDRSYFSSADEKTVLAPGRAFILSLHGRV